MANIGIPPGRSRLDVAGYTRSQQAILFLCLCLLFLGLSVSSLFVPLTESPTYDEYTYFDSGVIVLSGKPSAAIAARVAAAPDAATAKAQNPNIMPMLALYPLVGNSLISVLAGPCGPGGAGRVRAMLPIYAAKTATIAVSLLLACGVFAWARSLYGINAGFLALTLYVLDPNVIAHSRVVHQNILESCAIFAALYFFWKLVQAPSRTNAALAILAFSSAQITRFTALYLVPIYLLLLVGAFGPNLRRLAKDRNTAQLWSYLKVASAYIVLFGLSAIVLINIGFSGDGHFTRLGWYTF